jgi:diguanylate cyclase (GGDEF)-like protein
MHSLIDALTGVRNRRGFEEFLQNEVARAVRTRMPVSAIFIDLDHFKRVNDRYGHLCGDRVLQEVAGNIGDVLRPTDLLSRFGGEEFVALLPNCDNGQARGIARRINLSVAALDLFDDNGQLFHISCSVGYSAWLKPGERDTDAAAMAQCLIAQADKAVYQAKQEGRDRVCYVALQDSTKPCV